MSDPFHSSKYSIERAKHHISDFNQQVAEFFTSNPYGRIVEIDQNTSEEVHKLKFTKPMPVVLQGIAVDAVNNLRSALDQAAYAVIILSHEDTRFASFPFADSKTQFENMVKGRCKGMPKEIVDLIRRIRPYKGGNNFLWALNKICNTNKHAIICPVALMSGVRYKHATFTRGVIIRPPSWDRAKNEMELFRQPQGGRAEVDFNIATYIAILDVEFVDGKPAIAVLNEFVRIVEGSVKLIEAETYKLGLLRPGTRNKRD
ncbi:MAG TPA: hypothetical protein VEX70_17355 [Pyrinomonadaceae bacterium]|jgi:hypothetical protein|nr:hypothetical protein [Pyrinomonadaceae bacterium]